MPTFTDEQKGAVRHYAGYSEGWTSIYQRVEAAFARIEANPAAFARVTNAANGVPPGLLAQLDQIQTDIFSARGRLKAMSVGSITLNGGEMNQLRQLGSSLASQLCQIFGIAKARDIFFGGNDQGVPGDGWPSIGGGGGNFVGK